MVVSSEDSLRLDDISPHRILHSEAVDLVHTIFTANSTVEHDLAFTGRSGMVRDFAWAFAVLLNGFPLSGRDLFSLLLHLLDLSKIESPHGVMRTFFQVTSTVNIQIFFTTAIGNERAMV